MHKILIGSPVRQKENILNEFLKSLKELINDDIEFSYYFVDDNDDNNSSKLLMNFQENNQNVLIKKSDYKEINRDEYVRSENTHTWKKGLIEKIIFFKNDIISYAKQNEFDYLFFVDSDIIMDPKTIVHLISREKEIISNVFWTSWQHGEPLYPQVWLQDESNFYTRDWDNSLSKEAKNQLSFDFINKLKIPGVYEVGGLGACTLISKSAIDKGVSFSLLNNISFWGEDRHFCIRASALGIKLFVDTVFPAYHIYRESYIDGIENYKKNGFNPNDFKYSPNLNGKILNKFQQMFINFNFVATIKKTYKDFRKKFALKNRTISEKRKLTLSMVLHNEADRFLEQVLETCCEYIDEAIIIDDASTDETVEICRKVFSKNNISHKIIVNEKSMFSNEHLLREKQWDETLKMNPDWILFLDADEIFENSFKNNIRYLMENNDVDAYCFRLYDFWNKTQYRSDKYWNAHTRHVPFLIRYQPNFKYRFRKTKQHCGRMPKNVLVLPFVNSDLRLKHLGWSIEADRVEKYKRYSQFDKDGKDGISEQYKSILSENPNLIDFIESSEKI